MSSSDISSKTMIIAGAGPTGLAAALFLSQYDIKCVIFDEAKVRAPWSRALGVNPRTLDLLDSTGVSDKAVQRGIKVQGFDFHADGATLVSVDTAAALQSLKRPFNLALSQAVMEELLADELRLKGVKVMRGRRLTDCRQETDGTVVAEVEDVQTGRKEELKGNWLLGADGSRSKVRSSLNIEFEGDCLPNKWIVVDLPLKTNLQQNSVHPYLLSDSKILFMVRCVVDRRQETTDNVQMWRVVSNFKNPLQSLPEGVEVAGEPIWISEFPIGHKIASKFAVGNIFLAGDAAHIHSPFAARGMNLGIEDSYKLAQLIAEGKESTYGAVRREIDSAVVNRVRIITTIINGRTWYTRFIRRYLMPNILKYVPSFRTEFVKFGFGLDHQV